jgi:hypothetical protein
MALGVPSQESALNTLDRVLGVAVSRRISDEQRRELGLAVAWLQTLVDCKVLATVNGRGAATDFGASEGGRAGSGDAARKVA